MIDIDKLKIVYVANKIIKEDENGNEQILYGNGSCELVYKNPDTEMYTICLGPRSGEEIDKDNSHIIEIKPSQIIKNRFGNPDISSILDDLTKEFHNLTYTEEQGKLYESNDIQNEEIKVDIKQEFKNTYKEIISNVICQDKQIKSILVAIYKNYRLNHQKISNLDIAKQKQNILICGNTGTGKTEIIRQISQIYKTPMVVENTPNFTEAGYEGKNVEEAICHIIKAAGSDIQLAEEGIIVFDEIDKIADARGTDNVNKIAVQQALLSLMEGGVKAIDIGNSLVKKEILFDTSKLTFVFLGCFPGIDKIKDKRCKINHSMGFNMEEKKEVIDNNIILDDFKEYGFIEEFLGRISKYIIMNNLDPLNLKRILLESKVSPLKLQEQFLNNENIKLIYDEKVIDAICNRAFELNCGARSLKTIIDDAIDEALSDIFSDEYSTLELTYNEKIKKLEYILK